MLILNRKPGERIIIGDGITLTVVEIRGNRVRLAFEAHEQVRILRTELASWPVEPANTGAAEPASEGGGGNVRPPQG